jgi:hypothetical protein
MTEEILHTYNLVKLFDTRRAFRFSMKIKHR